MAVRGRDRMVVRWKNADGDPVERVVHGVVVMDQLDGKLEPFASRLIFANYYRLILPRSLNLPERASAITVSFRDKTNARPESAITPVLDARGRIHHYEVIVKSS
ncbi:MAG: hypothetical protein EKK34_22105 [Mycobacterium sp.]|nr:MAG: hypothetical protein EKK34_22105 [Mycobacterium sp.]